MTEIEKPKTTKGGSKGGTRFPRLELKKAIDYAKKLASKTHTGAQPVNIILPGVFNTSNPDGIVRASALKQYNLLVEENSTMKATQLAVDINGSPQDEVLPLLKKACLTPKLFKDIYEAFKGDTVNNSKIKQLALKFKVHPDSGDLFVQIFTNSIQFCGLGKISADNIEIYNEIVTPVASDFADTDENNSNDTDTDVQQNNKNSKNENGENNGDSISNKKSASGVQVNISLDSTMDTEKLEKLLKLLKNYGAL